MAKQSFKGNNLEILQSTNKKEKEEPRRFVII